MSNYFFLSWKDRPGVPIASAFPEQKTKLGHELIPELEGKSEFPFVLELRKVSDGKNGIIVSNDLADVNEIWKDYQPNSLAWPLVSYKLKNVIEKNLIGNEAIDWISCRIKNSGEERTYYILRFNKILDVLDVEKTMFVKGTNVIIKACFDLSKIRLFNIFTEPASNNLWKITSTIYVSEVLKKAIQREKITGVDFEKIAAVE